MKHPSRTYYTEADKALMWDRWSKGESLQTIGALSGRSHTSIRNILSRSGGIRPPPRKRSRLALSLAEREDISRGLVAGESIRQWPLGLLVRPRRSVVRYGVTVVGACIEPVLPSCAGTATNVLAVDKEGPGQVADRNPAIPRELSTLQTEAS
jgi:hypothetical protein